MQLSQTMNEVAEQVTDQEVKEHIAQVFPILIYPNPILHEVSEPVAEVDQEIKTLIHNLFITMYAEGGVGLSAIQCGIKKRVFVMDVSNSGEKRKAFVNPTILSYKNHDRFQEGCLSFPDIFAYVKRPTEITVSALNENGEQVIMELSGIEAICFQHELDHLNGVTFYDHLSPLKKSMLKKKIRALSK